MKEDKPSARGLNVRIAAALPTTALLCFRGFGAFVVRGRGATVDSLSSSSPPSVVLAARLLVVSSGAVAPRSLVTTTEEKISGEREGRKEGRKEEMECRS